MVDTLVEHRLNCAHSLLRCFSLTHETKYKTNVTLQKKLCLFKTFNFILTVYSNVTTLKTIIVE